jgi:hypothetical protein
MPEHTTALLLQLLPAAKLVSTGVWDKDPCLALVAVTNVGPYVNGVPRPLLFMPFRAETETF